MYKIIILLLTVLTIFTANAMDNNDTVVIPWQVGGKVTDGYCSRSGTLCYRVFLGGTADNKLLVQDFYSNMPLMQLESRLTTDKSTEQHDAPLTDPYTLLTINDAKYNLFHVADGREGFYRSYYLDGRLDEAGEYSAGKKNGLWLSMIDNDKFYGYYHNDKQDGEWINIIGKDIYLLSYEQGNEQQSRRIFSSELEQYNQQLQQRLRSKPIEYQRFTDFLAIKYTPPEEYLLPCSQGQNACYEQLYSVGNGLIVIEQRTNLDSPKLGIINQQHQVIVEPQYDQLTVADGYIWVAIYGDTYEDRYSEGILNLDGKEIIAIQKYYSVDYKPDYQMAIVKQYDTNDVGNYGVIDLNGYEILPIKYRAVYFDQHIIHFDSHFQNGNHIYSGFYNINSQQYIQPDYDEISRFSHGIAQIAKQTAQGYQYGLIDENGHEIVPPLYDAMYFDEQQEFAEVGLNNMLGMIDRQGQVIVPIIFERFVDTRLKSSRGDVVIGQNAQGYAVYNYRTGKVLLPLARYDHVWHEGRGFNYRQGDKVYAYDENGQQIINNRD